MLTLIAQNSQEGSGLLTLLLPLILMGGVFYFLLIRPQQRRSRAQQELLRSVEVGDEVVTTAGIFGVVTEIDDDTDTVTVEIAPGTEIRMLRGGISRRMTDEDEDEDDWGDEDADADDGEGASTEP